MLQTLTPEQWQKLYTKLCAVFNTYSSNKSAQAAFYLNELSHCKTQSVEKAVNYIIRHNDKFPTISQILDTINQLDPPPNPVIEQAKKDAEEWQKAEKEKKKILQAIDNLPENERKNLIEQAEKDCSIFESWLLYPNVLATILEARKILLFKQFYGENHAR